MDDNRQIMDFTILYKTQTIHKNYIKYEWTFTTKFPPTKGSLLKVEGLLSNEELEFGLAYESPESVITRTIYCKGSQLVSVLNYKKPLSLKKNFGKR